MLAPGDASPTFPFHAGWTLIAYGIPDDLPKLTQATFIGILIAVSGNILISLALNLQKLAHKRVEAQVRANRPKGTGNEHRTSGSAIQRRASEGPSLDERDEDEIHAMTPSHSNTSNARLSEVEPLNPSWREPTYGSVAHEANGHNPKDVRPRPEFTSHTMPRWFRGHNPRISAPVLPVDVVSADSELLQQTSKSNTRQDMVEEHNETEYLKSKLWWLGFFLMNVGETGNFISYAWAPASVVAPLGTFALIANCLFAPLLLGEHFRQRDLIGITIAIVGAVTVVLSTNASNTRLDPDALLKAISQMPFIIYSAIYLGLGLILATLSHNEIGRQWVFIDVGLCALFGGFTVLSTKAISTLLTLEWIDMFSKWITYPVLVVLAITGVGQIRYLNRALMRFDSKVVIPVQFVLFTLSAIIGSAILYGDFRRAKFHQVVTFLYGCSATFLGVFIIAWAPSTEHFDDTESGSDASPVNNISNEASRLGIGSLGRHRAALILPSGPRDTPGLRNQRSNISLLGLSPAQHLLLVHTPPRDAPITTAPQTSSSPRNRSRTVSLFDDNRSPGGTRDSSLPTHRTYTVD